MATYKKNQPKCHPLPCPNCGGKLGLRTPKPGAKWTPFYGCNNFRNGCKGCRPLLQEGAETDFDAILAARKLKFSPTDEQMAIWRAIHEAKPGDVIRSESVAGSGKTSTCAVGSWFVHPNKTICYLVFNKDAERDMLARPLPPNMRVKTLNGEGLAICARHYKGTGKRASTDLVNEDKEKQIFDSLWQANSKAEQEYAGELKAATTALVSKCKGELRDGTPSDLEWLAFRHDILLDSEWADTAVALVPKILEASKEQTATVSFDDQIWLPVVNKLSCQRYDVVIVDEAQDLNRCQHQMVAKLVAKNGNVVIIGDSYQAIYGFRGSDVDSIQNFSEKLTRYGYNIIDCPLTVTQRCPLKGVERAQKIVPHIKAADRAIEGTVTEVKLKELKWQPGDFGICVMNAPLVSTAYKLLKAGQKVVVRGRDIGKGLIALIERLASSGKGKRRKVNPDLPALLSALEKWKGKELAKLTDTDSAERQAQLIQDKADCIQCLAADLEDVPELIATIKSLFDNVTNGEVDDATIVLSSVHRAKGLEADRVVWISPEIEFNSRQEWARRQFQHLLYVGETRWKKELVLASGAEAKAA